MKIVNLTPHKITIVGYGDIEPSGTICRIKTKHESAGQVAGISIENIVLGNGCIIENLPEKEPNTIYIVSLPVVLYMLAKGIHRDDVYCPDTEHGVRDSEGQIVGVTNLLKLMP